jgi:glutaconate CoA-transferase subunit A
VPAIRPDVAVIHAQRADRAGNVMIEGIVGVQKEVVLAAKRSVVTVEEIVDEFGPRSFNAVILPHWTVGAVALVRGGAYPSYTQGYYKRDNAFYIAWDKIARERETFLAWMRTNVLEQGPEVFVEHARRLGAQAA